MKWEYQFAKTRISMPLHELLETDSRQAIPNLSIKLTARKACFLLFSLAKYYLNLPAINQLIWQQCSAFTCTKRKSAQGFVVPQIFPQIFSGLNYKSVSEKIVRELWLGQAQRCTLNNHLQKATPTYAEMVISHSFIRHFLILSKH